jgi:hypothetical protein
LQLPGKLEKQITTDIGPIAKVKEDLVQAGVTQFGSGWCWLAVKDGKITVMKTPNGENPLVHGAKPILGCDPKRRRDGAFVATARLTSRPVSFTSPGAYRYRPSLLNGVADNVA